MIRQKLIYAFVCVAIAVAIAYGGGTPVHGEPQNDPTKNTQSIDLTNRIVVLEITGGDGLNSETDSLVLANAKILKMGNRDFVVGDAFPLQEDDEDDWYTDVTIGAPCENIVTFRTMKPERFKSYAKKWAEQSGEE
jgi:hypothetical protein